MSSLKLPPSDVAPRDLFLKLLEWPRPREVLSFRFDAAPDEELWCQAISAHEWLSGSDRGSARNSHIIAMALTDEAGGRIFRNEAEVGRSLVPGESNQLLREILDTIGRIGPLYARIDATRWKLVLADGARECAPVVNAIAACHDPVLGFKKMHLARRPDRYFGAPMRELLDGHHMAAQAAYDLVEGPK